MFAVDQISGIIDTAILFKLSMPGRVDETADDPFAEAKREEVFATTGGEGELKATTIGVYRNHISCTISCASYCLFENTACEV